MAVSRKKAAAKKQSAKSRKRSADPKEPAHTGSARAKPATKERPKEKVGTKPKPLVPGESAKKKGAPRRATDDVVELKNKLAKALQEIRRLREDSESQAVLAEAAEMEHSLILAQLRETEQKLTRLEHRQGEDAAPSPVAIGAMDDDEQADIQEEEHEGDADDLDDVEAIYGQMDDPRVRRQELDRERLDRESEAGDEPYWMVCPKCGDTLDEVDAEDLKIDRCEACAGFYLDHGEVEMLLKLALGPDGLRRVINALRV